jgi:ABC-type sugar transport system substrate-binding protein
MMNRLMIAAAAVVLNAPLAVAGPIDSACARSDRGAGSRQTCGCIQQVADQMLSRADQRRAARFFRDADEAQEVRMSKSDSDNAFWARYKNFATAAEAYCAR